jgi:hypothetical protein
VLIPGVEPGPYQLVIEKANYQRVLKQVVVKARDALKSEVRLEWAIGFLSVTTDVPDAQISTANESFISDG